MIFKYCGFFGFSCLLFLSSDKLEQNNIFRLPSFLAFSFAARMMLELPSVDTSVFAVVNCPVSKLCKSAFFLHFSLEAGYLFCLLLQTTNVTCNCGHTFGYLFYLYPFSREIPFKSSAYFFKQWFPCIQFFVLDVL